MSYERCGLHGLLRCSMCAPKTARPAIPDHLPEAPEVKHVVIGGWSPEDELDRNTAKVDNTAVAEEQKPDKQALEAIERQKEIMVKRGDIAADIGKSVTIVVEGSAISESIREATDSIAEKARSGEIWKYATKDMFHEDPPFQIPAQTQEDPVVIAAREYASAQHYVKVTKENLECYQNQVAEATVEHERAITVRDEKHEVLKKLVAAQ